MFGSVILRFHCNLLLEILSFKTFVFFQNAPYWRTVVYLLFLFVEDHNSHYEQFHHKINNIEMVSLYSYSECN